MQHARAQQRLPHAIVLQGPVGTGKVDFAYALGHSILCRTPQADGSACGSCDSCHLIEAGTHPDLAIVRPEPPKDSKSSQPVYSIKIEVIRDLCARLATTSQLLGYRIVIIENADKMINAAANSLLKTLEEPGEDTLILLTTSRPNRLPVTIRSRCQRLDFPVPDTGLAVEWLTQQGIAQADSRLSQAHGAPLLAADEEVLNVEGRAILEQALIAKARNQSALNLADKIAKLPKYAALCWCLDWTSDLIKIQQSEQATLVHESARKSLISIASRANPARLYGFYDTLCEAIRQESIALNAQLLWENLLISWDNI